MTTTTRSPGRAAARLRRFWPTAVAIGMTALTLDVSGSPQETLGLAEALPLLPLLYLVVARIGRPERSWTVLAIMIVPFIILRALDVIAPAAVVAGVALAVLLEGAVAGQLRRPGPFRVQAMGMLGFGALALVGLIVDPDLGRYVVAAGWLLHGVWDFVHLKRGTVVSRSYAQWCGVLDVLVAVQLVLTGLLPLAA
jgi:hypothetical protein